MSIGARAHSERLRPAYSYRDDAAVPAFADGQPIIVFDGYCALCSGWVRFVLRNDPSGTYRFIAAQSPLGHALYVHYGLDPDHFETNILIEDGLAWFKAEGSLRMFQGLRWPWPYLRVLRVLPRWILDRGYDFIARNRLRFFGARQTCYMPRPEFKDRFLS